MCGMNYSTISFCFFSTGSSQTGAGQFTTRQTTGGNQGSSSNAGGKLLSMISCIVYFTSSFEKAASIGFFVQKNLSFFGTELEILL